MRRRTGRRCVFHQCRRAFRERATAKPANERAHPKIIDTYPFRNVEPRDARRAEIAEIEKNEFNLSISRYISTSVCEKEIDIAVNHAERVTIEQEIEAATKKGNEFLKELGLPLSPGGN